MTSPLPGIAVALAMAVPAATASAPVALEGATLYPRIIAVEHNAALRGRLILATLAGLRQSSDGGERWTPLSAIPEPAGTTERCCGTIFELPQAVGVLPAGTLLYAATYRRNGDTAIHVYRSSDGVRWRHHSLLATGGPQGSGMWEPQFDVADDGALVVFWSDESDPCCSQKLVRARTYDGLHWRDRGDLVRGNTQADRPGMPVTATLPSGRRIMTYEICGPLRCATYLRTSDDGWNYGPPTAPGIRIETAAGEHLLHAPTVTWVPMHGAANGRLIVVGQMVVAGDGSASPLNGRILLTNDAGGVGPWRTIAASVPVPDAYDNYCPNYSSALWGADDGRILMIASAYDTEGRCRAYQAWGDRSAE